MSDSHRYIPKGTTPSICKCGTPVYRTWKYSDERERQEPTLVDCEGEGAVRPKKLIGGVGYVHVCKKAAA